MWLRRLRAKLPHSESLGQPGKFGLTLSLVGLLVGIIGLVFLAGDIQVGKTIFGLALGMVVFSFILILVSLAKRTAERHSD